MFQFTGFASVAGFCNFITEGCPIRNPGDRCPCAATPRLSRLVASFIASQSLGILHAPFITSHLDRLDAVRVFRVPSQIVKEL